LQCIQYTIIHGNFTSLITFFSFLSKYEGDLDAITDKVKETERFKKHKTNATRNKQTAAHAYDLGLFTALLMY